MVPWYQGLGVTCILELTITTKTNKVTKTFWTKNLLKQEITLSTLAGTATALIAQCAQD
jgi:hypothetical protein